MMMLPAIIFAQKRRNPAKNADEAFSKQQYSVAIDKYKKAYTKVKKDKEEKNENVITADWDTVIAESREDAPAIVFLVTNVDGTIVDQVVAPATAGFNRVAWDLRLPSIEPWEPVPEGEDAHEGTGVLVVPGSYAVSMHKRVDGVMTDLGQEQTFNVVSIRPDPALPGSTQQHSPDHPGSHAAVAANHREHHGTPVPSAQ